MMLPDRQLCLQVMDERTQALGRMFASMQVGNAAQGQMYKAPPDNSWRKDVPGWFLPALTGAPQCAAVIPGAGNRSRCALASCCAHASEASVASSAPGETIPCGMS